MLLKQVGLTIVLCAIFNAAILISIGYHISVKQRRVNDIFNSSMQLYIASETFKCHIDEIQIKFRCCGHTTYVDWFLFDWQRVDYASREDMAMHQRISDEEFRDRGVPFSCCDVYATMPCAHTQMSEADVKTINVRGCSKILSQVLIRIVAVGYVMTTMLILIQGLLSCFIVKIARRPLPQYCPSTCSCLSSGDSSPRSPLMESSFNYNCSSESLSIGDERFFPYVTKDRRIPLSSMTSSSVQSRSNRHDIKRKSRRMSSSSSRSWSHNSSVETYMKGDTARITPSTHMEHRLSKNEMFEKGCR